VNNELRQQRGLATRGALLRSARFVFARDGFEHARLEDIAARAKKTRGAFYDNFKDKEDAFLAIFEEDLDHKLTEIGPLLRGLSTDEQRIDALARYLTRMSKDVERMLLIVEFKLYAIRHPRRRKRMAALIKAMHVNTSIPELNRLLPQLTQHSKRTRLIDSLAICGVFDGLALNHLFDPEGLSGATLTRYLKLSLRETLPASKGKRR
jgi:AcrR family transcriptional regulator